VYALALLDIFSKISHALLLSTSIFDLHVRALIWHLRDDIVSSLTNLVSPVPDMARRRTLWYAPHIRAKHSPVLRNIQRVVGVSLWCFCESELASVVAVIRPPKGYGTESLLCRTRVFVECSPGNSISVVVRKATLRTIRFQLPTVSIVTPGETANFTASTVEQVTAPRLTLRRTPNQQHSTF